MARALPPSDFAANAAPFRVVLTWALPPEAVESYAIRRDGLTLIHDLEGSATRFVDETVLPGREYVHEIEARGNDTFSDRIPVATQTPMPALPDARLAGDFAVRGKILSQSGYGDFEAGSFGWSFDPRCRKSACDVVWRDLHERAMRARLDQRRMRYHGTYGGLFWTGCGGARATSSVTLDLTVTKARVIGREWRATRFEGTLSQSEAAQLGCRASGRSRRPEGRLT